MSFTVFAEERALVCETPSPATLLQVIPDSFELAPGFVGMPHDLDRCIRLTSMGLKPPSPIEQYYRWPRERTLIPDPFALKMFGGINIIEVEPDIRPVLRIRDEVPCTPEVRREVNAWLLEMFGTQDHSPFARGQALMLAGRYAMLRKEDAVLIKNISA